MGTKAPKISFVETEGNGVSEKRIKSRVSIVSDLALDSVPEMLTAKDLEAILKIDVKTIYSYVQKGLIPFVRIQSNVRFPKKEILDWLEEQSYKP
jgi:excisionase family DNA binding protein